MPFPFQHVCHLLQQLDEDARSPKRKRDSSGAIVEAWFRQHILLLDAPTVDGCAILSTLLPTRRTDRVYAIKEARLQSIIEKALMLGCSRVQELRSYLLPGSGLDLADCVENVLTRTVSLPILCTIKNPARKIRNFYALQRGLTNIPAQPCPPRRRGNSGGGGCGTINDSGKVSLQLS